MGVPYFQVKSILEHHNVVVTSSNFSLYADMSRRIMNLLAEEDVPLEIYSVDEAFIDLTHLSDPYQYVCDLRERFIDG